MKKEFSWHSINIEQWYQIYQITKANISEIDRAAELLKVVMCDTNADDVPIAVFAERLKFLDFLKDEMPKDKIKKEYSFGGRVFELRAAPDKITAAQYIDYKNYAKEEEDEQLKIGKYLSVFFVPKGETYGDYDMAEVITTLEQYCNIATANSVAFFLQTQLNKSIQVLKSSLAKEMKKTKTQLPELQDTGEYSFISLTWLKLPEWTTELF